MDELRKACESGVLTTVLHLADADCIDGSLDTLQMLYEAGIRSLAITWSRPNIFGHGVPFGAATSETGPGLSDLGINFVEACNELES